MSAGYGSRALYSPRYVRVKKLSEFKNLGQAEEISNI